MKIRIPNTLFFLLVTTVMVSKSSIVSAQFCDKQCLEDMADQYRAAYVDHDPARIPVANDVRYTENFVELPFPDGTWDTVTEEVGPPLIFSDPETGQAAIFTSIMQKDTPGFLAIRFRVNGGDITEIEHVISTRRNLSSPPTPIAESVVFDHDPQLFQSVPIENRHGRDVYIGHAHGYFDTLQLNDGEIRSTRFTPEARRLENGLLFAEIEAGFKSGYYFFNNRVRRWPVLVDEERGIVLARGFIDHKGVLDEYTLTNGETRKSIFREPQTWGFLELFKVLDDHIVSVEATFIQAIYYMPSPWNPDDPGASIHTYD